MRQEFAVQFKSGDTQPVTAFTYVVDGEALIFLNESSELVAFFDLAEVADWSPRFAGDTNS